MQSDLSFLSLAFGAGIVAFLNPCGFALLPSYITYYLGIKAESGTTQNWWRRGLHGLLLGVSVSVGFFTVFIAVGLMIVVIGSVIGSYLPWLALLVGLSLIGLSVKMLVSRELALPTTAWAARLTGGRSPRTRAVFYYLYGIGYALASCGCTLPIFMIYVVSPTLTTGLLRGFLSFLAYASGMALMMLLLSLSIAYSKGGIDRSLPLHWALVGVSAPIAVLLLIVLGQPGIASSWLVSFSGTNRVFVIALAPALVLSLFFQLCRWERATHWLNALILLLTGSYLIYYQIESGLLDFSLK